MKYCHTCEGLPETEKTQIPVYTWTDQVYTKNTQKLEVFESKVHRGCWYFLKILLENLCKNRVLFSF